MSFGEGMQEESEEQDFADTVEENAFLCQVFDRYSSCQRFLTRPKKIYVRSVRLDCAASDVWLNYESDIDGCVIELTDLTGIELPLRHLTICPYGARSLKEVKTLLKKHVRLIEYSKDALPNFNESVGMQLFYEHGWEGWLALIPDTRRPHFRLTREVIRQQALCAFQQVRLEFKNQLVKLADNGVAVPTLMKNDLGDLRTVFVLPSDRSSILEALQTAVNSLNVKYFQIILFCFRFGEKMRNEISLNGFKIDCIKKVTVHAALTVSCQESDIDVLWSMEGIQEVVGRRGNVSTCLSLRDCGTFQSQLDGTAIDISPELRSVCVHPEKLTFMQLYADVPHLRPKTRFHPVSGLIAGGLCFPKSTSDAFSRDSDRYISSMKHNFSLLLKSSCRLEAVVEVTEISGRVKVSDCIDIDRLYELLQKKPLLVPVPSVMLHRIQDVGLWLCRELKDMQCTFAKTGNVNATWRAFQFELACEKVLWGRPLCDKSYRYSVNLGPGVLGPSRSLTDHLGFLALEAHSSCMNVEVSMPPVHIWTASDAIGKCILRAAGLHDHIDASYSVTGRLLILALLKDLHEIGKVGTYFRFEEFLPALKRAGGRFETVGAVTVEALAQVLATKRRTPVRMVYGNLCRLIEKHRLPLREIVEAGLIDLELHSFPALETYDSHGNAVIAWNFRNNFWAVIRSSEAATAPNAFSAEMYSQLAKGELETRGLIFPSKLKKLPAVWPWTAPCLRKLAQEKLSHEATVAILAFISAIAFIMLGWFIDFDRFAELFHDLPIKQFRLKTLEILSPLELPRFKFKNLKVFRLHTSIPHQLKMQEKEKKDETEHSMPAEDIAETVITEPETRANRIVEDDTICGHASRIEPRSTACRAIGIVKKSWSANEMEIFEKVSSDRTGKTVEELYFAFRDICLSQEIPLRTFQAFKKKMNRMMTTQKKMKDGFRQK